MSVSALSRVDRLKKRWDIAEGISGAASAIGKVEGHEQSVRDAYNGLSAPDKSVITNPTTPNRPYLEAMHKPTAMIMGLQYPDMPIGGADVMKLGDDLTTPDHVTAGTFGTFFKAGSLGARNTFVSQTHYGCLQFWHAMAPEPFVGGKYKVWTNAALSELIKNGAKRIWAVAVDHLKRGNKNMAEFHLGRILHTIGDSYAKGHTTRGPSSCGKIFIFQEYNAQKGNEAHGSGDKPATNQDTFACAVQRIREVLSAWAGCVRNPTSGCGYPAIISSTFDVDPSIANNDAGGSLEQYAGPTAKSTGSKKQVTIAGKTLNIYFPPQGTLQRVAGDSSVANACPRF
jgi:hypothetical protein